MTEAKTLYYKCRTCGETIEYLCPAYWLDGEDFHKLVPILQKHFKAQARYNHNMTHKGELDNYV